MTGVASSNRRAQRVAAILLAFCASACRTPASNTASVKDAPEASHGDDGFDTPAGVPAPYAKGTTDGLFWEARFNMPPCDHPGKKKGVFCTPDDQSAGAAQSGVEAELTAWANDPKIKSLQLAYFSFSDEAVIKILCDAASNRGVKVNVYLHRENMGTPGAQHLKSCSPNIQVVPRGTTFGSGYLQHAKIFLASPYETPLPIHMMPEAERAAAEDSVTYFTSSSANMSTFGTSLHFDNWLFFTAKTEEYLVQENLCFFNALATMETGDANAERRDFAQKNHDCIEGIEIPMRKDIVFYPVPHAGITRQIYPELKKAITDADSEIKMASDRLTTKSVFGPLDDAQHRGVKVHVILDDDTLRTGKCDGGPEMDQGPQDVQAMRSLMDAGVDVTFMETNGDISQLQHNKFIVFDDKMLLQGAGNFTSTSLNVNTLGNMEHFYLITTPEIVQTYSKAWDQLRALSTTAADHEVGNHKDKPLVPGGALGMHLDDSVCDSDTHGS